MNDLDRQAALVLGWIHDPDEPSALKWRLPGVRV